MSLQDLLLILKGSSTSGNWGHAGIPGHWGGSKPKGGLSKKNKPVEKTSESKPEENGNWAKKLSKKEEDALLEYAGSGYQRINSALRSGKLSAKDKATVEALDSALSKSKLSKDTTLHADTKLFRAADIPEVNAALKAGKLEGLEFTDKAFVSTTTDKNIARNFLRSEGSKLFVINAPKGTKAGDISSLEHGLKKENETLLARNTSFKVAKIEKVKEKIPYRDPSGKIKFRTKEIEYIHLDVTGQS